MTLRWLAVLLLALLSGCNAPVPEPEDPYEDLPTQTYPFKVVWECTVEALEAEGFSVANSQRDGEEGGEITTGYKVVEEDALSERLGGVVQPSVAAAADLDGMMVTVSLVELPTSFHPARGKVIEVLGQVDDFGVDVEVVIRKHHIPYRFTAEALAQAEAIPD